MAFYRKKQLQEMEPWTPGMPMECVGISTSDRDNGSPKKGDMIAINPNDSSDMWLVAEKYFKENYELVADV